MISIVWFPAAASRSAKLQIQLNRHAGHGVGLEVLVRPAVAAACPDVEMRGGEVTGLVQHYCVLLRLRCKGQVPKLAIL